MTNSLIPKLILCIIICVGLGAWVGTSTAPTDWFDTITKPSWQPPSWLFAPVWTTLYAMIGASFALVWQNKQAHQPQKTRAMLIFAIQFALNLAWSFIFFNYKEIGWAFAEIMVLWVCIILTVRAFYPIDKRAAYLLIPYLCWVSFASVLTGTIWWLNR